MALPDFLIVGAMKAATTTLYADLATHPGVFLPELKEPEDLLSDRVLAPKGRRSYERLFRSARPGQRVGEASTAYTKRPEAVGVPERALTLLGPRLRIIYLVRDPIDRMVSHYRHEWAEGAVGSPMRDVLLTEPRFVDYSRYAYQLGPWIGVFGKGQVLVLRFEEFVQEREVTLRRVCDFLGLDPAELPARPVAAQNRSGRRPVAAGSPLGRLVGSELYGRSLKQFIPRRVRRAAAHALLTPNTTDEPDTEVTPELSEELLSRLSADDILLAEEGGAWPIDPF